jgi:hypothetical protein
MAAGQAVSNMADISSKLSKINTRFRDMDGSSWKNWLENGDNAMDAGKAKETQYVLRSTLLFLQINL